MKGYELIEEINAREWKRPWLDFSIFSYDRGKLIVAGSYDLSYYHNLEITFIQPEFIDGVTEWSCDVSENFIKCHAEGKVIEFYSDGERKLKLIAEDFLVNFDTVFYYPRENLTDGQRLAYWLI
ncbi:hypothetical protein BV924_21235 [Pectobacterium odoriferum]|uniref:Uncharacterized protein n=1 Tax=Pectobacterium odoriferum TaxID=78398 RepID=A0ABD6VL23_9GAMM|nr:hypothetical protein [Pectobacterium odoriferum]POD91404.1 hypothetical protein BVY06_21585 [Pectobacterium odoriferum]POE08489.1 hypothetical protein BV924_21235 [Pectobacterium odoriferum]POE17367.1 hypothetical protein BV923_22630 [Pectobacterium odoriferum]POE22862.1 hypothetical protein BV926_21300 [Pectobacterium odoriferum]POE27365.1 hypothetical protein BV919_20950 [Pectobacterium odoriferum]